MYVILDQTYRNIYTELEWSSFFAIEVGLVAMWKYPNGGLQQEWESHSNTENYKIYIANKERVINFHFFIIVEF